MNKMKCKLCKNELPTIDGGNYLFMDVVSIALKQFMERIKV